MSTALHVRKETLPKVLLLTDSPAFAGTERHIYELAIGLKALDSEVWVGCPTGSILEARLQEFCIPTVTAPEKYYIPRMLRLVTDMLGSEQINVVHAHNGISHLIAAAARAFTGKGRCISTHHFLLPNRTTRSGVKAVFSHALHKFAADQTDGFIAVSNAVANACQKLNHSVPMTVVHNGLFFQPTVKRLRHQVRRDLNVPHDSFVVVSAARLDQEKSIETLIRAMDLLLRENKTAVCLIAGEGKEKESLERLIQSCGRQQSVRLIGFQSDILSIMNAADVFVLPSTCEPFGLVLLEAMSMSIPVVAAAAGGPLEIIESNVSGCLFPPGDSRSLFEALTLLCNNSDLAHRLADAGKSRALSHFNAAEMSAKTLAVYKAALSMR